MRAAVTGTPIPEVEERLVALITARTGQMRWRPGYEAWVQSRIWQEREREPVIANLRRLVPRLETARVLDLGSGMGGLLVRLEQEGLDAVGLEYSAENCTITQLRARRYGRCPKLIRGCAEHLPLRAGSVDVILCYEVIEHVADPDALLCECRRVLAPDGVLFLTVPNRWSLYDHHYHLWGIGFLPRPAADRLVARLGRAKTSRDAGVQALAEMHYYSWRALTRRCARLGFTLTDLVEAKLAGAAEREISSRNVYRVLLPLVGPLRRLGLLLAAYRAFRWTVMHAYHVILRPGPLPPAVR